MMKTFTRGGQVTMHNIRMIRQVLNVTILVTLTAGVLIFGVKNWYDCTPYERSAAMAYYWADFKLHIPLVRREQRRKMTQFYTYEDGSRGVVRSMDIVKDPWHQSLAQNINNQLINNAWLTLWWMGGLFMLVSVTWFWYGHEQKQPEVLSGLSVVNWRVLRKKLKKYGKKGHILGKLPCPEEFETEHMLLVGTTGSGKTNALNQLLSQTKPLGEKTIVVDTTGGYVARFYNEKTDKILNPFDERSQCWNLWQECLEDYDFMEFAESLIPPEQKDRFWVKAAQQLLATAAENLKQENKMTISDLLEVLLSKPLDEAVEDFRGTNVVTYFDPESGKMAHGIRATLIAALWSLKYLEKAEHYFSIREWVQDFSQTGWLFICCQPGQRNVLRPLMTGWLSIAIKSLMALPEDLSRRVWFIMDELASLNYVPCLVDAMQEARKYGGCVVLGMQNFAQVHKIYGQDDCNSIFDLAGTKIGLRSNGDAATQLSKTFGQQEILEAVESISYGAHQMRDGISLSRQRHIKPVVSTTDLMMLNPLEAYIKFPRNLPIAKVKFPLCSIPSKSAAFVKKKQEVLNEKQIRRFTVLSDEIYADIEDGHKNMALEKGSTRTKTQLELA